MIRDTHTCGTRPPIILGTSLFWYAYHTLEFYFLALICERDPLANYFMIWFCLFISLLKYFVVGKTGKSLKINVVLAYLFQPSLGVDITGGLYFSKY